jgi:hypothetical protein
VAHLPASIILRIAVAASSNFWRAPDASACIALRYGQCAKIATEPLQDASIVSAIKL